MQPSQPVVPEVPTVEGPTFSSENTPRYHQTVADNYTAEPTFSFVDSKPQIQPSQPIHNFDGPKIDVTTGPAIRKEINTFNK